MTDAFNSALDAFEAELNRIEPLDLPALREYVQEHPGCSWEDACDWHEQITGRTVPEEQYGEIEAVWQEESASGNLPTTKWDRSARSGMTDQKTFGRDRTVPSVLIL